MANMIKTTDYSKNQKQILIGQESYYIALPVIVSGTANSTIYAGQPVKGDITARDTAFKKATTSGSDGNKTSDATAILLHDVDVTSGKANGTIVLAGCIDLLKLDSATQALIDAETKKALSNMVGGAENGT